MTDFTACTGTQQLYSVGGSGDTCWSFVRFSVDVFLEQNASDLKDVAGNEDPSGSVRVSSFVCN